MAVPKTAALPLGDAPKPSAVRLFIVGTDSSGNYDMRRQIIVQSAILRLRGGSPPVISPAFPMLRECRSVAQSGSAPRSGRGGRRFKSYHSDHFFQRQQPGQRPLSRLVRATPPPECCRRLSRRLVRASPAGAFVQIVVPAHGHKQVRNLRIFSPVLLAILEVAGSVSDPCYGSFPCQAASPCRSADLLVLGPSRSFSLRKGRSMR